jgi:hypothetical protein
MMASTENYIPEAVYISAKFVTTDKTNGNFVEDHFVIDIYSSGEGFSSMCDFSSVVLAESMADSDPITYEVTANSTDATTTDNYYQNTADQYVQTRRDF